MPPKIAFKCPICVSSVALANKGCLKQHLAADHFDYFPYGCEHCPSAKFTGRKATLQHYEQIHGIKYPQANRSLNIVVEACRFIQLHGWIAGVVEEEEEGGRSCGGRCCEEAKDQKAP